MISKFSRTLCRGSFPFFLLLLTSTILGQSDRETWQPPEKIMDAIGVKAGMVIGEAGAGSGYFTFPLAERVGKEGKIFANDISRKGLGEIQSRSKREGVNNIETVLGEIDDPLFPRKDLDMIIMVYVLHHLEKPLEFLDNLKKYLKPEARLVIIERNAPIRGSHYPDFLTKSQVQEMLQKTIFQMDRIETFLPKDNIFLYKLPGH